MSITSLREKNIEIKVKNIIEQYKQNLSHIKKTLVYARWKHILVKLEITVYEFSILQISAILLCKNELLWTTVFH